MLKNANYEKEMSHPITKEEEDAVFIVIEKCKYQQLFKKFICL